MLPSKWVVGADGFLSLMTAASFRQARLALQVVPIAGMNASGGGLMVFLLLEEPLPPVVSIMVVVTASGDGEDCITGVTGGGYCVTGVLGFFVKVAVKPAFLPSIVEAM